MDSIALYNQNGQKFDVDVVRYFAINKNKYLIFSLNEVDKNGYIQLYVSKVDKDGMKNITDDNEWNNFKTDIQRIVTNNRNNILNGTDLDYNELNESVVSEFRIFKLKEDVAKTLSENKNPQKEEKEMPVPEVDEIVKPIEEVVPEVKTKHKNNELNLEAASANNNGLTIEEILRQVSEGAKSAREVTKINLYEEPVEEVHEEKKFTIDDLLKSTPIEEVAPVEIENKYITEPADVISQMDEEVVEEKVDYELKYKDAVKMLRKLEDENTNLINELVEAKAKLATIKDMLS